MSGKKDHIDAKLQADSDSERSKQLPITAHFVKRSQQNAKSTTSSCTFSNILKRFRTKRNSRHSWVAIEIEGESEGVEISFNDHTGRISRECTSDDCAELKLDNVHNVQATRSRSENWLQHLLSRTRFGRRGVEDKSASTSALGSKVAL